MSFSIYKWPFMGKCGSRAKKIAATSLKLKRYFPVGSATVLTI
jgi:hypothetical protein